MIIAGIIILCLGLLGAAALGIVFSRAFYIHREKRHLLRYMNKKDINHPYIRVKIEAIRSDDLLALQRLDQLRHQILMVERSMKHA